MYANKVLNLGFSILVYRNLHSRLQIIIFYMYIYFTWHNRTEDLQLFLRQNNKLINN